MSLSCRYCFVSRTCNKSSLKAIYTSIASHDFSVAIEIQLDKAYPESEILPHVYLRIYVYGIAFRASFTAWSVYTSHRGANRTSVSIGAMKVPEEVPARHYSGYSRPAAFLNRHNNSSGMHKPGFPECRWLNPGVSRIRESLATWQVNPLRVPRRRVPICTKTKRIHVPRGPLPAREDISSDRTQHVGTC